MIIGGLQRTSTIDFPGRLSCVVFARGCDLDCFYCHNRELLAPGGGAISQEEVLAFLEKRRGLLDGVVVSGGEPTLQPDLPGFLRQVKAMDYQVKLDTNGGRPEVLKKLVENDLLDYVAMDIKNSPGRYGETAGLPGLDVLKIQDSVELLKKGRTDYEFRTTVTRELHGKEELKKIGEWLRGSRRYFLQNYRDSRGVIRPGFTGYSREQLERFREMLLDDIPEVGIRGVD